MKTTVENLDPVKVKLTVEVEPARVKKAFDEAARHLAQQVTLPGFRKGKVPRKLLEQRLGTGAIAQHAMEDALNGYYAEALEEAEIDPVAMPEVDVKNFDETDGCTFEATVEIRPQFDVPDHTGISVVFPDWDIADEDVDEQIAQLRERFAEVDEVERAAATGDYVTIDLRVSVDGEELESAHVEDALYEIGSAGVTPKLDDELVGASAGDELTYTDNLPDEYPEHGGEEAEFTVTVKDVREKTLPDLDDDFAATASEFDTFEELKKDIRDSLLRRRITTAQHELRGRILEAYLANVDVPLPPSMVEQETQGRIQQVERQAEQYGLEMDQLLAMEDTSREDFEENARKQATEAVKAQLVLDALADSLNVQIDSSDIDAEIVRHARANDTSPQQIAQIIQQQG
ncbi:MAG: trigger factor, partial [Actinobacteria bacterium]|nr:trigger factor [Actinomycetota bacterium]